MSSKAQLKGTILDILKKQSSENKKIFGMLRQEKSGISLAIPQSIPSGAPTTPVSLPIPSTGLTEFLLKITAQTLFTELSPAKKIFAKWKLTGFNASWLSQVLEGFSYLTTIVKHGSATGSTRIRCDSSEDDITYNDFPLVANAATSPDLDFVLWSDYQATTAPSNFTGTDTLYIRMYGQRTTTGTTTIKSLSYGLYFLLTAGINVQRLI